MHFHKFDINPDNVEIDATIIPRPARMSASQWIEFWEAVRLIAEGNAEVVETTEC